MPTLDVRASTLVIVDMQTKLMAAMNDGPAVIANARRLSAAAELLGVPALFTEQNPKGLGPTVPDLAPYRTEVVSKMTFDAMRAADFRERIPERNAVVVAGCEAHVCVLQTALSLAERGRRAFVVRDAVCSRSVESLETALRRMEHNDVEIVTTEMVLFEWLETADNPRFREAVSLIK